MLDRPSAANDGIGSLAGLDAVTRRHAQVNVAALALRHATSREDAKAEMTEVLAALGLLQRV